MRSTNTSRSIHDPAAPDDRPTSWVDAMRRAVSGRSRRPVDAAIARELQIIVDRRRG